MMPISKNVPEPPRKLHPKNKYPFWSMALGDSVFVPRESDPDGRRIQASAYQFCRRNKGYRFRLAESEEDGVPGYRLWRVALRDPLAKAGVPTPPTQKECSDEEQAAKAVKIAQFKAEQLAFHGCQPAVEVTDRPVASAPVSPLPPHTVMIDGVLHPDPSRPWVAKRFEEFTVEDRRSIMAMYKHVEWELLNDDEGDMIMDLQPTPPEQEPTT